MTFRAWWLRTKVRILPPRRLVVAEGDALPQKLPWRSLVVMREGSDDWCVGMRCPCGCRQRVELALIPEASPRWYLQVDQRKRPTLHPSVWLREGCRSHFFVRAGKVAWV